MYLKSFAFENVGPIANFRMDLPIENDVPKPLVLVGPNGSGKSTVLSFVVNALVGFKQQVFDEAEIEQKRVYRVRSSHFIRGGSNWYHAQLEFENGLSLEEWVLDRPKERFEKEVNPLPTDAGWQQISEGETNTYLLEPNREGRIPTPPPPPILVRLFSENVVLFFPSDRFELPDWLNEKSLHADLKFPEPMPFQGQTRRRIFSRALLRPTLEWLKGVVLDSRLSDFVQHAIPIEGDNFRTTLPGFVLVRGRNTNIFELVREVLTRVLGADSDSIRLRIGNRNSGVIAVEFTRHGRPQTIPNLLGLSAGQAALFCLFCNIIRDLDLTDSQFTTLGQIRGIVLIDEADLHLHVELQYRVLPELMKLFPKVQFIVTAHAPLFVMGMENTFGSDGFEVRELPSGDKVDAEVFTEFEHALDAFVRTRAFDERLLARIRDSARPVLLVEGKTDRKHLEVAWEKLHPGEGQPWEIVPCGGVDLPKDRGGAEMLRTMLRACCLHLERSVLGIFDHDREGMEQFLGLEADGITTGSDDCHKRHKTKPVHAVVLPVPVGRKNFVSQKPKHCYLAIEHLYSDPLLRTFGIADDPVAADSSVFGVVVDTRKKGKFADAATSFESSEFAHFQTLFDRLVELLGIQAAQPTGSLPTTDTELVHRVDCGAEFSQETVFSSHVHPKGSDATTPFDLLNTIVEFGKPASSDDVDQLPSADSEEPNGGSRDSTHPTGVGHCESGGWAVERKLSIAASMSFLE